MSVVNRYCVKNLKVFEVGPKLKKHINEYSEKFEWFEIMCEWKIKFEDTIMAVVSERLINKPGFGVEVLKWMLKIHYIIESNRGFSHIPELKITFTTKLDNMTYKNYNSQPMQMIERVLYKKINKNPERIKTLYMPFPVVLKVKPWLL